jgi:hypothetical protein
VAASDPAKDVELVYKAADAVLAAYKAVNLVPFGKRTALDTLLDGRVFPGDFDDMAKKLKALADEWQSELDAEVEPFECPRGDTQCSCSFPC